ncbi:MAG: hypothetical protein RR933_07245, partial [Oscillospiraceae bacterium]
SRQKNEDVWFQSRKAAKPKSAKLQSPKSKAAKPQSRKTPKPQSCKAQSPKPKAQSHATE